MKKLIYQVAIGQQSKLYEHCTSSVEAYANRIGADYKLQIGPIIRLAPDPFMSEREGKTGGWKRLGYMPIFEKENVFNYFDDYDACCVIDADIYVRPDVPDIFQELDKGKVVASVYEADMPINEAYAQKISAYSRMVSALPVKWNDFNPKTGFGFFNSGVMLYNSNLMLQALNGLTAREFLEQPMLMDLINGKGPFKWQSDQITLNYWFKKKKIEVQRLDWKWNALYTAVHNDKIPKAHFVHFFLKDHLPDNGENVEELMKHI